MPWDVLKLFAAAFAVALLTTTASAQVPPVGTMPTGGLSATPLGHIAFCKAFPAECTRRGGSAPVRLTRGALADLANVNIAVNHAIAPVTDADYYGRAEYWTLPATSGDCEDYALLKRRHLIRKGWPSGALLVAVVFDEAGDGHAVLVARTDEGDLVLDNRTDHIREWHRTPYRYVKRQAVGDPRLWVSVSDNGWRTRQVSTLR